MNTLLGQLSLQFASYWLRGFAVVLLILISTLSFAATQVSSGWQQLPGQAIEIATGADQAAAIDPNNNVWRWDNKSKKWRSLPGRFSHIDIGSDGTLWGVSIDGQALRYINRQWQSIGTGATHLSVGKNADLIVVTNTGSLARYLINEQRWEAIEGTATTAEVASDGWIWTLNNEGIIARQLENRWIGLPGRANDISINESGRIVTVTPSGNLNEWNPDTNNWNPIQAPFVAKAVAAGPGNSLWVTDQNGTIHVQGLSRIQDKARPETKPGHGNSGGNPAQNPDTSEYDFTLVKGTGLDLSIGIDGSVFALQEGGELARWSNTDSRFNDFPGDLDRVELDWSGLPWGVGRGGTLYRHDGAAWREVRINLDIEDLSIGADERVLVLGKNRNVYELKPPYTSYTRLNGSGTQIAVVPDRKTYWLLDSRNRIFRCNSQTGCSRMPLSAIDLEVGPGGTVMIIDRNNNLRRFSPKTEMFELVPAKGARLSGRYGRVAIGPNDRPWVVSTDANIYASEFFERDESQDRTLTHLSKRTANVTKGDGGSGIVILNAISFTSSVVPSSASGFPDLGHGLMDLTSGYQDIVLTTGFSKNCVPGTGRSWSYDANSRTFNFMTPLENANFPVIVHSEFFTWADDADGFTPPLRAIYGIFPQSCSNYQLVEFNENVFTAGNFAIQDFDAAVLVDFFAGTNNPETDLDTSQEGWIVWSDRQGDLGFHDPVNGGFFTLKDHDLTFTRVGIGADLDTIWVVDSNNNVYQLMDANTVRQQKLSTRRELYVGNGTTTRRYIAVLRSNLSADRALDVGVGFDNTVWIVDLEGRLKRWDQDSETFKAFNKTGMTRVAVSSTGKPIVANFPTSRRVYFGR